MRLGAADGGGAELFGGWVGAGWGCCGARRLALLGQVRVGCGCFGDGEFELPWWRSSSRSVRPCSRHRPLCRTLPVLDGALGVRSSSRLCGTLHPHRWGRSRRCSFLVLRLCGGSFACARRAARSSPLWTHRFLELFDDGSLSCSSTVARSFFRERELDVAVLLITPIPSASSGQALAFPRRGGRGLENARSSPQPSPWGRGSFVAGVAAWRSSRFLLSEEWREDGTVSWKRRGFELSSRSSSSLISLAMAS